jgi:uncharacterized protein (DUF952 family)
VTATLYHITSVEQWTAARTRGDYVAESLAREGFIHCSYEHQVIEVANRLFRGRRDLVLLYVDRNRLGVEARDENLEGGQEQYPHVYGPIPLEAIIEAKVFEPAADGLWRALP